jgi:indolepyruvate ferredoxin oxidoreductase alpha subunit
MNDGKSQHATSFLLGNEAIARAALEAGIHFASGYPGTPSSEIIRTIVPYAEKSNVHVEWSVNEKVACEGAAAAAFAGLRSLAAMKNAGLSVALDFLTHLSMTGLGDNNGSLVVVVCDDPDGHSSGDETDSRWLARFSYAPLLDRLNLTAMSCYEVIRGFPMPVR